MFFSTASIDLYIVSILKIGGILKNRTAIIVHGGAIKGAFAAGVMYYLSRIGIQAADIIVGTSSCVPTAAYFTSRQFEFIKNIWLREVGSKDFINRFNLLAGKPIFNLPHLINTVFQQRYPLNVGDIVGSESLFLVPLYNYREGRVEFINNRQEQFKKDSWKVLQAALTVHDQDIVREVGLEQFVDADLDPFALYRQQVIPNGHNVLVVINHKDLDYTLKRWLGVRIYRLLQSKHFPDGVKDKLKDRGELIKSGLKLFQKFEEDYRPILISPPETMNLNTSTLITRNKDRLNYLFEMGVRSVMDIDKQVLSDFVSRSQELLNTS